MSKEVNSYVRVRRKHMSHVARAAEIAKNQLSMLTSNQMQQMFTRAFLDIGIGVSRLLRFPPLSLFHLSFPFDLTSLSHVRTYNI